MDTGVQKHYYGYECDTQENSQSRPKTRTDRTYTCVSRVIISGCIRSGSLEARRHYTQLL
jgi:hypothetical protein